jgi:hypothetical protein
MEARLISMVPVNLTAIKYPVRRLKSTSLPGSFRIVLPRNKV